MYEGLSKGQHVAQRGEFREVGHTGGKVTFTTVTDPDGHRKYQIGYHHSAPRAASLFAVYALSNGLPVGDIKLGGIGQAWNPPPMPGCFPVFIASDSEGMFGHECPGCGGYWRGRGGVARCPYCGGTGNKFMFLSKAQWRYVEHYCDFLRDVIDESKPDGTYTIDMDVVADAVGDVEKPAFYIAEESQQKTVKCDACGDAADILGRYCFCPQCGTRNDLAELQAELESLRGKVNTAGEYETSIAKAVGAFDTFAGELVKHLAEHIPMTQRRQNRLAGRFHNLKAVADDMKSIFDVDILSGISPDDIAFATRMFFRRHVYEHKGGVVDQKYLDDSGDTSVRLGQSIREDQQGAHRLIGIISRVGQNFHDGFHEIFPPEEEPVRWERERKEAMAAARGR